MLFLVLVKHFVSVSLTNLTSSLNLNLNRYKITYVPVELRLEKDHDRMLHLILKELNFKFMKSVKCRHQFFF